MVASNRSERTRALLAAAALRLFEEHGFEATSVAQIAKAAGVTEMTFFRHFGSKEQAVLTDPFDPVLAEAIGARPPSEAPVVRTVRGLRAALGDLTETDWSTTRQRVRLVARTPTLRSATVIQNETTAVAIRDRLVADGADPFAARIAAAATLAALTAALYEWAEAERLTITESIGAALDVLERGHA